MDSTYTYLANEDVPAENAEAMRWRVKRGGQADGDVQLSKDGLVITATFASEPGMHLALNWAAQGTRAVPRDSTQQTRGQSESSFWYYEVENGVAQDLESYTGDLSIGFVMPVPTEEAKVESPAYWKQITYEEDGMCRDAVGALFDVCFTRYAPRFVAGDVIGCGVDHVTDRVFFTKNGAFLGMTQNSIPKGVPLTPFVLGRLIRATRTLTANFGQRPFQSLSASVLRNIADAQTEFVGNPERLPRKWGRCPAVPMTSYEEDDCVVLYKSSLNLTGQLTTKPRESDARSDGHVFRSNLPMPPLCDFFYFEVELVMIPENGVVHVGFVAGDEDLGVSLGSTHYAGSWGYSSVNGNLYQAHKQTTYGRSLTTGDVIGCGLDRVSCRCFFTVNGLSQGTAPLHIGKPSEIPHGIYPATWIGPAGGSLRINCGSLPFKYDLASHIKALQSTRQRSAVLGSYLPDEIIDHIIRVVPSVPHDQIWCSSRTTSRMQLEKRFLGLCSLTCRHWARRCRPYIFGNLQVVSLDDAAFLTQLVRTPQFSIGPHLQQLRLHEQDGNAKRPWVLQTLAVLGNRLPQLTLLQYAGRSHPTLSLQLAAEQDRRQEPPMLSSRLSLLLRSFKTVKYLLLTQLLFRDFSELARIVRGMEKLELFAGLQLIWQNETDPLSPRMSWRGPIKMRVDRCTNAFAPLRMLGSAWNVSRSTNGHDTPSVPYIASEDALALRQMIECMVPETLDIKTIYASEEGSEIASNSLGRVTQNASKSLIPQKLNMTFHYPNMVTWEASVEIDPIGFACMHHLLKINFVTPAPGDKGFDDIPLEGIDTALATIAGLKVVLTVPAVTASTWTEEDVQELRLELLGKIQRRMANLQRAGMLSVEFFDGPGTDGSSYNTFLISD